VQFWRFWTEVLALLDWLEHHRRHRHRHRHKLKFVTVTLTSP
jgi:hypothetical protein